MGMVYFMENPVLKWMITGGTMDWKAPNDGHIVDGTNPNGSKIMTHIQFKCPIVKYIVEHLGGMVKIAGYALTREDQAPCLVLDWGWFMIWVCHMTFLECAGFEFVNRLKAFVWPAWLPAMFAIFLSNKQGSYSICSCCNCSFCCEDGQIPV